MLDAYLGTVSRVVYANGGTVVSFQGDGVMTAFGVPTDDGRAAQHAVDAARELLDEALPALRTELAQTLGDGPAGAIALGIGIATGPVFAGTVGPATRREYAVVGPPPPPSRRELQARTKEEAGPVLIDDATAAAVMGEGRATAHTGVRTPSGPLVPVGPREIRASPAPSTAGPSPADAPRAGRVGSPAVADTLQHHEGPPTFSRTRAERRDALTSRAAHLLGEAGYRRIETPIFEGTELFKRGVGGSTDIVRKEMYTFEGRRCRSMTLRPRGHRRVAARTCSTGCTSSRSP